MSTTVKLVERAARALGGRIGRRSFLTRTAVAGSALAVAPLDYTLKPLSAYAAICNCNGSSCGCGALCCDGYTEFCCTMTGHNKCPAGTEPAGWWKVDGSTFCGSGPRYYFDCNVGCGPCTSCGGGVCSGSCTGTGCGCLNGSCANRKTGCTHFRYGQCNQHIACLGPIKCRVITCIPPWELEPTCTTTTAVDNNTRYHDGACLHTPVGKLELVAVQGSNHRVKGWALDPDTKASIKVKVKLDGKTVKTTTANITRNDVAAANPGHGPQHGFDTTVNVGGGTLCVYAVNSGHGPGDTLLGCQEIDNHSPVGNVDNISHSAPGQISTNGWVVDPDTPDPVRVHIYVDGTAAASLTADAVRNDIGAKYPSLGPNHGFAHTLDVSGGTHTVTVYAINKAGPGGTTKLTSESISVGGSPFGFLEKAVPGPGQIDVAGWAIDPDIAGPVRVHVHLDGNPAASMDADQTRGDIGSRYPGWGADHGYSRVISAASGTHTVTAYAINKGSGSTKKLGSKTVTVGGTPFGFLEKAVPGPGQIEVAGWAIDPDVAGPARIHIHLDGSPAASLDADAPRGDVGARYPDYGPNHGYNRTLSVAPGTQVVTVYAIDKGVGSNKKLGTKTVVVPS